MKAIIVSIGDELVLGQTVDTNSAWLSGQLAGVGCEVGCHLTLADDQRAIEGAIREMAPRCDWLVITGGLGPTDDDLTRDALARVLGAPLELNAQWVEYLQRFFAQRNRPMPERNKVQAMLPRGVTMLDNPNGTAPGMLGRLGSASIAVMPGVPSEMKPMFTKYVLPRIAEQAGGAVILSRTLHTFGLGESAIAEKLGKLMDRKRNPSVGTTVSHGLVSLRVNSRFPSRSQAQAELEKTAAECRAALDDLIFGEDQQTLQEVVAAMLLERKQTVATAESCTGGLLAKMLTDISGSSGYFSNGWITYSNEAKYERLGVSRELIGLYGAVSEPVVSAMASGARRLARSDYALAISGVAGPTGGTPAKPVGLCCFALAHAGGCQPRAIHLFGDREMVRDRAAKTALTMLRYHLLAKPLPF